MAVLLTWEGKCSRRRAIGNCPEGSTQNERGQVICRTFRSKKFALKVRRHFHTSSAFQNNRPFSAEKRCDEFPFVLWHLPHRERHEPRRFWPSQTLKAKIDHWGRFRRTLRAITTYCKENLLVNALECERLLPSNMST